MARWLGRGAHRSMLDRREHERRTKRHQERMAAMEAQLRAQERLIMRPPPWLGVRFETPGVAPITAPAAARPADLRRGTYLVDFVLSNGVTISQGLQTPLPKNATIELVSSETGQRAVHQFRLVKYAMLTETFGRIEWVVYLEKVAG